MKPKVQEKTKPVKKAKSVRRKSVRRKFSRKALQAFSKAFSKAVNGDMRVALGKHRTAKIVHAHLGEKVHASSLKSLLKPMVGKNRKKAGSFSARSRLLKFALNDPSGSNKGKKGHVRKSSKEVNVASRGSALRSKMARAQVLFHQRDKLEKDLAAVNSQLEVLFR